MDNLQKLPELLHFIIDFKHPPHGLMLPLVNALTEISQLTSGSRDGLNQKRASKPFQKHIPALPQESGQRHSNPSHGYATAQIHLGRQVSSPIPTHSDTIWNTSTALSWYKQSKTGGHQSPPANQARVCLTPELSCETVRGDGERKKKTNLLTGTMIKCSFCSYSQEGDWDNIPSIWGNVPSSKHHKPLPPRAHPHSPPHTQQWLKFSLGEN